MKKLLISLLITALALICTACANAAADTEVSYNQPELKYGRYYLNGDVNSKLYIDLDENYIVMGGEDELRNFFEDYFAEIGDYSNEELFKANVDEAMNAYAIRSEYGYTTVNAGKKFTQFSLITQKTVRLTKIPIWVFTTPTLMKVKSKCSIKSIF